MRLRIGILLSGMAIAIATPALNAAESCSPEPETSAIQRSLSLIQASLTEYPRHVSCFSCHHQGVSMLALSLARSCGYRVDEKVMEAAARHTEADLRGDIELYRSGKGQPGGVTRAGYALLALRSGGVKRDDVTAAVTGFLLKSKEEQGYWNTSANRPPSEMSAFTDTFVAIRALNAYGEDAQKDAAKTRIVRALRWLETVPTKDTEDRVFRLWALAEAGAAAGALKKASAELLDQQREDGGWAQLPGADSQSPGAASDAYATGSALTALCLAGGLSPHNTAFERGIKYLLRTQEPDGSWHVVSRSKPFQPYFESGFPHGKDQFISMAASGWATAALILKSRARAETGLDSAKTSTAFVTPNQPTPRVR